MKNWECKAFIFFKKNRFSSSNSQRSKKGVINKKGVYHVMPCKRLQGIKHGALSCACLVRRIVLIFTLIRYLYGQQKDDLPAAAPISILWRRWNLPLKKIIFCSVFERILPIIYLNIFNSKWGLSKDLTSRPRDSHWNWNWMHFTVQPPISFFGLRHLQHCQIW